MVYVINHNGKPLMPTSDYRKVRLLLKSGAAKVVRGAPFTIKLQACTHEYTQEIILGIDAGSKTIGISASTETKELFAAELKPRNDVVELLSTRREFRRARRNRTTRYRAPKFNNRIRSKNKGWLAPSVEVKIHNHIQGIRLATQILPIAIIVVETAEFDIRRLRAVEEGKPLPVGSDYQIGEMYDAYNVRQYVLHRDGYRCCKCGAHGDKVKLHVHHLESRKTGGEAPKNKIALCEHCHKAYHLGLISLEGVKAGKNYRDAAFMGIMRPTLMQRLLAEFPGIEIRETKGYITKLHREQHSLPKTHVIDALCIAGHPQAMRLNAAYTLRPIRSHNRQIHKASILKSGVRKLNQSPKYVFGYQLFDKVLCNGEAGFIFGRRASGYFDVRRLDGTKISAGINCKKLTLLGKRTNLLIERSQGQFLPAL